MIKKKRQGPTERFTTTSYVMWGLHPPFIAQSLFSRSNIPPVLPVSVKKNK